MEKKEKREGNHLGQRRVGSSSTLAGEAPAAETWAQQTPIKHKAIFLSPAGGAAATNCRGLRSRAAAPPSQTERLRVYTMFGFRIKWMCVGFEYIDQLSLNTSW